MVLQLTHAKETSILTLTHRGIKTMATSKLFNVVGVSKLNGEYKVRFATDIMRIKVVKYIKAFV